MKIWKTKIWSPMDIAFLKWSTFLAGVVVGAFFADWVKPNWWWLFGVAILLAIKPSVSYWGDDKSAVS